MALTVLSVAYPLAPVSANAVGGAEQVLSVLDRALTHAGHRSLVVACEGSQVSGRLIELPSMSAPYTQSSIAKALDVARAAVERTLESTHVDVVHIHALDFAAVLPRRANVSTLVTLHLPRDFYPHALPQQRENVLFNCVSAAQHATFKELGRALLAPIENAAFIEAIDAPVRQNFALVLARICYEKGIHLAIDAAQLAMMPLIIAGQVFPYETHQTYFNESIEPRLNAQCRFVGAVRGREKRRLLSTARCVLVPSLATETSSLVALEALACGTPVVAFDRGALREIIEQGRTGFLVNSIEEMAQAMQACEYIASQTCRETARRRFSLERMINSYFSLYERLARNAGQHSNMSRAGVGEKA